MKGILAAIMGGLIVVALTLGLAACVRLVARREKVRLAAAEMIEAVSGTEPSFGGPDAPAAADPSPLSAR